MNELLARIRICLALALGEMRQHKGRSALSVVSVVLGIASLASMVALCSGLSGFASSQMTGIRGPLGFKVSTSPPDTEQGHAPIQTRGLTRDDLPTLRTGCPAVGGVIATKTVYASDVARNGRKLEAWNGLIGTDATGLDVLQITAVLGRRLADSDVARCERVALVSPFIRTNLFAKTEACIGQKIELGGVPFEIVGAITNKDDSMDYAARRGVIIPITAMPPDLAARSVFEIAGWAAGPDLLPAATQQMYNALLATHQIVDFRIDTNEEVIRTTRKILRSISLGLGGIATISLIVSAVNIMSVALVSLNRRVREIGVHKAIGAGPADLFAQFIVESLLLSLAGGVLGLLLANLFVHLLTRALSQAADGQPFLLSVSPLTIVIALGSCMGVGFLAGLYPAIRAARMDAVEALRQEG